MRQVLQVGAILLTWVAFRPPTAEAQTCATATVNLDYRISNTTNTYIGGDWRNRASAPVPDASSFTQVGTTYTSADANSTLATNPVNGQTLSWSTTYSSAANANTGSTVTYTFSRPVTNLTVRVQDIDAVFTPADPGGFLGIGATPSSGFTDEVRFTGANGATAVVPTLARANTVTKYTAISGNTATGIVAGGNNATTDDATVIATYPGTVTSITLRYRNLTAGATIQNQAVGIDNISWCRIAPTATAVTTTTVASSATQAGIRSLSGTADGILAYELTSLPPSSNGTLFYNTTGTTYVPVAVGQTLTVAQAASLRYTPNPNFTGTTTTFSYRAKDDAGLVSTTATYTIPLGYVASCGTATNTFAFNSRPANEDWKAHTALAVPAGATTTISSGPYSSANAATSTLQIGNANSTTLAWNNDFSTTAGTSSVTFTFSREVSNFTTQVQDIDATAGSFVDMVTFAGANTAGTSVTPFLSVANPSAGVVTVSGATATGQTATTSTVDGTVTAFFPNPIKTLTITYASGAGAAANPAAQVIGIDNMSWCRLAPTANNITNATVLSTATQASLSSLSGSNPDGGTIASYVVTSLPANGTLLYSTAGGTYAPVTVNQTLTAAQAASLRYSANQTYTGTSTTFTYRVVDEAGAMSANTATYTIPLQYVTPCGTATNTFAFNSRPANEDWKNHAALAVPTGATTTISSSNYLNSNTTTSTLQIGAVNSNSLAWNNDFSTTAGTSSVTFTFSREVSNFTTQVQDIDATAGSFVDMVTFAGANTAGTSVTPFLSVANPSAGVVTVSGATATGQTATTSTVDGTVTAFFPNPIKTLTITYASGAGAAANPAAQVIGIDNMSWCRLAPTANDITNATVSNSALDVPISSLSGSAPDGTIKSYTIGTLPPASQGVLYVNGTPLAANSTLTPAQAAQLTFTPNASYTGSVTFNYLATDDASVVSNNATYTIPVVASPPPAACASPGKDLSTFAAVPNTYYPGVGTAAAGATQLTLGTLRTGGSTTAIGANDLLLVIQMQGADINNSNTDSYGDGVAGGGASGNSTANLTAGQYEYVVATGAVDVNGKVNISSKLVNSYATSPVGPIATQRTFQVIRIPQYSNLTLTANVAPPAWNGSTGGVVALDVAGTLNFGGRTINASGLGFRGGAGRMLSTNTAATAYLTTAASNNNAQKGEGTAGTPQYINNNGTLLNTTVDGYPGGSSGRGAPGNAGGGGDDNSFNSGGGGGANGGGGGRGGNTYKNNTANGGEPGAEFSAQASQLVMGGGGGAGSTNEGTGNAALDGFASSGAAGGGLVLVRAGSVSGSGSILANAAAAINTALNDGAGGGGAGGSILVTASVTNGLSGLTLSANGSAGGNNRPATNGGTAHGPGGGGGGGVILTNGPVASASVAGGASGQTTYSTIDGNAGSATATAPYGAAVGNSGTSNTNLSTSISNSTAGANCVADVATTITGPTTLSAGQLTDPFTVTFANIGTGPATSVMQRVTLPAGAGLTAAQRATIVAAYPGTTFTTTGTGVNAVTVIDFGTLARLASGASFSYSFAYTAPTTPTTTGSVATISNVSTTTPELGLTANNTATTTSTVGAAADVSVALSGPTTLNAGQPTGTFTATFTNQGPSAAANVARIVTLPSGATVSATQQTTILASYPNASFATPGVIDFGPVSSLASDASSVVMFAFTAPTATGASALGANISTTTAEGTNSAPNTTSLALNTVATADVVAAITPSATATTGTFQVVFSNNGPQTAAGIGRSVQLPTGLTNVTLSDNDASYDPATGLVTYAASPDIASGSSLTTTITYSLASSQTPVAATATISTTTNEAGLTANNTKTAVMPAQYDLATTLTGPTATIVGSPTTLYVTTTNNGPNSAPLASQTLLIPSDAPLTNVYITNGGQYVYNTSTKIGTVTFPAVANMPSGEAVTNSISFSAPATDFAPSAVVVAATGDTNTTNNTAFLNGSTTSTPVAVKAATLAKTNEATTITADATIVSAGTVVTYTVQSFNNGFLNTKEVTNVAEQVQLIPGLTASTLTVGGVTGTALGNILTFVTANGTTTYNASTGMLVYPGLATQASGSSFTYDKLAVTVPANTGNNGQLLATASVSTDDSDPVPADNSSSVVVKVLTPADLVSTLTGPGTSSAGQTAIYTAMFTNRGTGSATSVVETAQLPAGLSNVQVQDASGNVIANAYNILTGLVTFPTIATAPAGSSQVYNISLTAPAQSFSVSSFVSSGTTDDATTNNTALLRTVVSPTADVAVYVSGPATAVAGNAVTYAVTTVNNGPNAANAVQGTLQLPAGLTGVTTPGGGSYNTTTGLVTFLSVNLAAGESRVSLVNFTMPTSPDNGQLSATAAVSTSSTDLVFGNNTSAITTDVAPATLESADLSANISVSPVSPAVAGTTVVYTLSFRNNSSTTAAVKVTPTSYLPAGLQNVIVRDANNVVVPNAYNSVTGQVVLPTIDSQAAGNLTTYTVSLTTPSTPIVISASAVSSNTSDPNPANNIKGDQLNINASYDVVTSLTGPTSAQPGSVNTYSVTTTNNGPSTSSTTAGSTTQTVKLPVGSQVVVSSLPAGASYDSSTGLITFPAISSQAANATGAITNTFMVVMPTTGTLDLTATVTAAGESNTDNDVSTLKTAQANQAPIAQNVWNTLQSARGNTATNLLLSPLNATDADGTINGYTVLSLPSTTQGILYLSDGSPVLAGQTVPAAGLYFAPTAGFVGNATFTYRATDNGLATSNTALYTIPVAQDQVSTYTTYNTTKGNANPYVTGDVLAQSVDPNAAVYTSNGVIYTTTGVLQSGAANGLASAVLASGTLPTGVSLDAASGRIYVSDASLLPRVTQSTNYTVQVTTTDANGGISTVPVTLVIGANPLPVVLVTFTAQAVQNRDALLSWATASEQRNDHFEVERSFDGTTFTKIGQVAGHGTTSAASAYTFTDASVAAKATGAVYYRLRQVDLDGTATYSPQRTVSFTKVVLAKLTLFPNPVQSRTTLDLSALAATTSVQAQLLDATGRQVRTWTLLGGVAQPLELADLASGSYLLVVTGQQPDGSLLKQTLRLTKE